MESNEISQASSEVSIKDIHFNNFPLFLLFLMFLIHLNEFVKGYSSVSIFHLVWRQAFFSIQFHFMWKAVSKINHIHWGFVLQYIHFSVWWLHYYGEHPATSDLDFYSMQLCVGSLQPNVLCYDGYQAYSLCNRWVPFWEVPDANVCLRDILPADHQTTDRLNYKISYKFMQSYGIIGCVCVLGRDLADFTRWGQSQILPQSGKNNVLLQF